MSLEVCMLGCGSKDVMDAYLDAKCRALHGASVQRARRTRRANRSSNANHDRYANVCTTSNIVLARECQKVLVSRNEYCVYLSTIEHLDVGLVCCW